MAKFNDGYYDPPDEDMHCKICHYGEGDCTCPECPSCGEVGNPACINVHMPWDKWPHFRFQLSEAERKAERDHETIQRMMEQEAWRRIDKEDREEIEHVIRLPDDEEFLNLIGQLDTEPRCTHSRAGDGVHVCPDCGQQLD